MSHRFNIRVYGIILNANDQVLVSDERRFGSIFTKFPGGGLEWGEGLKEGLARELKEELGLDAIVGELIYVNDFFQRSAFRESDQIISFYFRIDRIDTGKICTLTFEETENDEGEWFRWVDRSAFNENVMTFPVDKVVAGLI